MFHNRYDVSVRSTAVNPLHGGGAIIKNARYIGISSIPLCRPWAALNPTPKHMSAISPAPASGTDPDTIAIGVNAVSKPTVRYAIAWPPISKFDTTATPPSTASDDAATSPLTAANTTNGTLPITTTAIATPVRRTSTCDCRARAPSADEATVPPKRATQALRGRSHQTPLTVDRGEPPGVRSAQQ